MCHLVSLVACNILEQIKIYCRCFLYTKCNHVLLHSDVLSVFPLYYLPYMLCCYIIGLTSILSSLYVMLLHYRSYKYTIFPICYVVVLKCRNNWVLRLERLRLNDCSFLDLSPFMIPSSDTGSQLIKPCSFRIDV